MYLYKSVPNKPEIVINSKNVSCNFIKIKLQALVLFMINAIYAAYYNSTISIYLW